MPDPLDAAARAPLIRSHLGIAHVYDSGYEARGNEVAEHCRGALATLAALIAVGIGALCIWSMSASRVVRPSSFTAPCSETCSGRGYRPQRRTSRTLLPVDRRRALTALVYRRDTQPSRFGERDDRRCDRR